MRDGGRVPHPELRELLFADLGPAEALERLAAIEPIRDLAAAATRADTEGVRAGLNAILAGSVDTRLRLQAWAIARAAGIAPPDDEAHVARGVVVDMGLDAGTDTLAGYADGSARYFNQSGAAVIWDAPGDAAIGGVIGALLAAGQAIVDATGPLDGHRPPAPGPGTAALWILTDAGIHAGIGPADVLAADPLGGPLIGAAVGLMQELMARSTGGR